MDLQNRTFPYPVLCDWSGDYADGSVFDVEIKTNLDKQAGKCEMTFCTTLKNEVLQQLLEMHKAELFCNIECSGTAFRASYPLELAQPTTIVFDKGKLNGKVEFCPAIIAKETLLDYRNTFDEDYGPSVNIAAGLMLAIGRQGYVYIETSNNLLAFIPSAFVLSPLGDNATVKFEMDYNNEQVNLKIEKNLYKQYKNLNTSPQNRGFLVTAIFLPALVMILSKMQTISEQENPNFSEFEDYKWFKSLDCKVKELFGKGITDSNLYNPQTIVLEIANRLLEYPIEDSFTSLLDRGEE